VIQIDPRVSVVVGGLRVFHEQRRHDQYGVGKEQDRDRQQRNHGPEDCSEDWSHGAQFTPAPNAVNKWSEAA
jgi:hypothetical protein